MVISKDFYKEEVRCEYFINADMKKVWVVELDLLQTLLNVCERYNIKIFAAGGTLLGAVRHGGFIPWDDDIDLIMMRDDYDMLCSIAEKEFKYPYFFQTEYSDPGSFRGHAQLRNSNTTAIIKGEGKNVSFNQGIFIDIFPLDAVIDDERKFKKQRKQAYWQKKISVKLYKFTDGYEFCEHTSKRKIFHVIAMFLNYFKSYNSWYKDFETTCSKYNNLDTKMISLLSFVFDDKANLRFREDFDKVAKIKFEMLQVPVPENYIHALDQRFGNWKVFVRGTTYHGEILFDADKSYKEYVNS